MTLPASVRKIMRPLLTLVILALAVVAIAQIWQHYMHDPWTRDGRVRADVINLGTDVSGLVENLQVEDNDFVHAGDVLFTIDRQRYQLALDNARANLNRLQQQRDEARAANARRQKLKDYVSQENKDDARFSLATAQAEVEQAKVEVEQAQLDLKRATVRAPVDGYVTNLLLRPGQYVSAGEDALTLVDANSFYALGYFEETKLDDVHIGAPARVKLMSNDTPIWGARRQLRTRHLRQQPEQPEQRTRRSACLVRLGATLAAHSRTHRVRPPARRRQTLRRTHRHGLPQRDPRGRQRHPRLATHPHPLVGIAGQYLRLDLPL